MEEIKMEVTYNEKTDLLYLRMDTQKQKILNKRIDDDVVLDIGKKNKIIGIEIMNASEKVNLNEIISLNIKEKK